MDLDESLLKISKLPLGDLVNASFLLQIYGTHLVEEGKMEPLVHQVKKETLIETLNDREKRYSKRSPIPICPLGLAVYRLGQPFGVNCTEAEYLGALCSFRYREEIYLGGSSFDIDSFGELISEILSKYLKMLRKPEFVVPLMEQVTLFITKINQREQLYLLDPEREN